MTLISRSIRTSGQQRSLPFVAALLALSALMSGCAETGYQDNGPQGNVGAFQGAKPAGTQLSQFLDNASPGSSTAVAQSPLGQNLSITTGERYYSASGTNCMQLHIEGQTSIPDAQNSVACQAATAQQGKSSTSNWVVQRSVISIHQNSDNNGNPAGISQ